MAELAELEQRIASALARIGAGVARLEAAPVPQPEPAPETLPEPQTPEPQTPEPQTPEPSAEALRAQAQALEIADLQAELERERAARQVLDHALNALQSPPAPPQPVIDTAEVDRLTRQLDVQGLDNQRLRSSVAQLREELRRLREAAETGAPDAALINRALQAELDALRAVRGSEITEMADILAVLGPLVDAEEGRIHA